MPTASLREANMLRAVLGTGRYGSYLPRLSIPLDSFAIGHVSDGDAAFYGDARPGLVVAGLWLVLFLGRPGRLGHPCHLYNTEDTAIPFVVMLGGCDG